MIAEKKQTFRSSASPTLRTEVSNNQSPIDPFNEEPQRPDWLVLFMSALFLLALLIAWLVDIPALLR